MYAPSPFFIKSTILFTLLFSYALSSAQSTCTPANNKYMNNWYFGNGAGITFKNGNPSVLIDGEINQREGCASISDDNGNLLFYTDGQSIYNKKHVIMANGNNLNGDPSSTQSAIICPVPESSNLYYIFTCGIMLKSEGIQYSLIDMNLMAGDGAVVHGQKNITLYQNNNASKIGTVEKLAATYHSNNSDIWLIYHEFNNNSFVSQLITKNGIEASSVKSNKGPVITNNWDATGYMKFSPNSKQLASSFGGSGGILMLDFNNTTGKLTNEKHIILPPGNNFCYGVEFSPNNNFLYVSTMNSPVLNTIGSILQYNLQLGDYNKISLNPNTITLSNTINYGALQLGPDGVIYSAKENGYNNGNYFLGTISSPDNLGQKAQYNENSINLLSKQSLVGLPTFLNPVQNCTLPLKILEFSVTKNTTNINSLKWIIENANELSLLILEKSTDGYQFEEILKLQHPASQYNFEDKAYNNNSSFYRLKTVSTNNIITYSKIIEILNNGDIEIKIYPNPIQNSIFISSTQSGKYYITLIDINGNKIYNETFSNMPNNTYEINTSNYPDGIYFLKVQSDISITSRKIVKNSL